MSRHASFGGLIARSRFVGVLLLVGLTALVAASVAAAEGSYTKVGSFGSGPIEGSPGGESGEFNPIGRLAVENSSGNIFVVDQTPTSARVQVFSPKPSSAKFLTQFGLGILVQPTGIAIDQDSGDVYVSDAGAEEIFKFTSDGAAVPTFTLDAAFTSPASGPGAGEVGSFAAPLAFDDVADRLLVADPGAQRVDRFEPDGTFESSFDGSDSGTPFTGLKDLTVLPDQDVVVIDGERAERFGADGTHVATIAGLPSGPDRVAYDALSNEILIATSALFQAGVYRVDPTDNAFAGTLPTLEGSQGSVAGLAVHDGPDGKVYVATSLDLLFNQLGQIGVEVFTTAILPDVTIDPPSSVGKTSAHLSGAINPLGQTETRYHFEYSADGGSSWTETPELDAGEGEGFVPVAADIEGLLPNTSYLARLAGVNAAGKNVSATTQFQTPLSPPRTLTTDAGERTTDSAVLHGFVSPFGLPTTYHFEYGETTDYGLRVPADRDAPAGTGYAPLPVDQPIGGLQPGTTYHYRLVAESSEGVENGVDKTFTTLAADAPPRAYELVSPADKGGAVVNEVTGFQASPDGNTMAFATRTAMDGGVRGESAPQVPMNFARRSASGWSTIGLDPPQTDEGREFSFWTTLAVSEDGSKAVVISLKALAPGAVEGDSNVYLRDTSTGAFTTIASAPGSRYYRQVRFANLVNVVVDGNSDFSHVLISGIGSQSQSATPPGEFIPGTAGGLYEWANGQLREVSVLPDGTSTKETTPSSTDHSRNRLSADASRAFFDWEALYVRHDGTTTPVSVSQRDEDAGTIRNYAQFQSASPDGRIVVFTSFDLTDDSPPGQIVLYRADLDSGALEMVAQSSAFLQASNDADYLYFGATGGFYVWHDGQTQLVAPNPSDASNWQASPNGKFFTITSSDRFSPFDNAGHREVYRYEADTGALICVSCRTDGRAATGSASTGYIVNNPLGRFPTSVLDDGRVYFDTPDPLVRGDSNSTRDVYEFDGSQARLISGGNTPTDSTFADVTPDGSNVFFTTTDQLVAEDTDLSRDVYDARIGGGLASQDRKEASASCGGEDCRGAVADAPPPSPNGSEVVQAPRKAKGRRCGSRPVRHKAKARKHCHRKKIAQQGGRQGR